MTLLDYYGPEFEMVHGKCTCPLPIQPIVEQVSEGHFYVTNRCDICGLEYHAQPLAALRQGVEE